VSTDFDEVSAAEHLEMLRYVGHGMAGQFSQFIDSPFGLTE
jgi:hypothetical protein